MQQGLRAVSRWRIGSSISSVARRSTQSISRDVAALRRGDERFHSLAESQSRPCEVKPIVAYLLVAPQSLDQCIMLIQSPVRPAPATGMRDKCPL